MPPIGFRTILQPRGPAAAIVLDDAQVAEVGEGAKAFPVVVTVKDHTWRGRVARMGGENLIGLTKATRGAAGVQAGDEVDVTVALDDAPREVELPPTLREALDAHPTARARFDALSYSTRKEHARAIADAKRDETRERRLAKLLGELDAG